MKKGRITLKMRSETQSLINRLISSATFENQLRIRGWLEENGFDVKSEFGLWNPDTGEIEHLVSGQIFNLRMSKSEIDELSKNIQI